LKSLHPIKVLKKDAVPTINGGIKIVDVKSIEDELSKTERKKLVDKLLEDYEEQQKNENDHLNGMVTKYPSFFSPKINPNAKLGDKLKLLKSMNNPKTYPPSKKRKMSVTKLNTQHLESPFVNNLTQKLNDIIQVTVVKGGIMLHTLPQTTIDVSSPHLEKSVTDEEEEIIIVTEDEANLMDLSSYEEEDKGNNTEVIIVTDSKETEDTVVKSVPKKSLTNIIKNNNNKCQVQKLLKNNESLFTPSCTGKVSLSEDKGCQVIIPCKGCENRSLKINKLLRERTKLLKDLNQNDAWKDPDEINTLKRMNGVLSMLLMQCVGEKNGKKPQSIRVDFVQDSIEKIDRGWTMQDTSEVLSQALSVNAYDEFARAFEIINEI